MTEPAYCGSTPNLQVWVFITSAKEVMFSSLFVCLSVYLLASMRKNFQTDLYEIFRKVGNGPMNK